MKTIVIIPAYNEASRIFQIVRDVIAFGYDALVINDGSADTTADEARRAGARVLRHFVNRGYGAALTTGMMWARRHNYDVAVHFDADGQHEAGDIARLIQPIIDKEADVVLGSRFISDTKLIRKHTNDTKDEKPAIPLLRKILIKIATLFTWFVSGVKLTDAHNGLRAFSRQALDKIDCRQDGMSYASEVIDQIAEHKLRVVEVPVTVKYTDYSRTKGESNVKKVLLGARFLWEKMTR